MMRLRFVSALCQEICTGPGETLTAKQTTFQTVANRGCYLCCLRKQRKPRAAHNVNVGVKIIVSVSL